jgi:hypothetical protein
MTTISTQQDAQLILQLNEIALDTSVDLNSEIITDSIFFKKIQDQFYIKFEACIEEGSFTPEAYILAIRILATSTSLHTIYLDYNNLREHGPAGAASLATSTSLHTIDLSNNNLGKHGLAVAASLATSKLLTFISVENQFEPLQIEIDSIVASNTAHLIELDLKLLSIQQINHDGTNPNQDMFDQRITIKEWELLKHCDKTVLSKTQFANRTAALDLYFTKHAFAVMGVCKKLEQADSTNNTGIWLGDLAPETLQHIFAYIAPNDYRKNSDTSEDNTMILGSSDYESSEDTIA